MLVGLKEDDSWRRAALRQEIALFLAAGLSIRQSMMLWRSGVRSIEEARALSDEHLLGLRAVGRKTVALLRAGIADRGHA